MQLENEAAMHIKRVYRTNYKVHVHVQIRFFTCLCNTIESKVSHFKVLFNLINIVCYRLCLNIMRIRVCITQRRLKCLYKMK